MQAWMFVMRRVISVVEKQKVEYGADKVSRMIMFRPSIGMYVLDVIEDHDQRDRTNRGKHERKEPHVESQSDFRLVIQIPTQKQHGGVSNDPHGILEQDPSEEVAVFRPCRTDKTLHQFALKVCRHERISTRHCRIVFVGITPRDRRVAFAIHQPMMVEIMRRNPHHRRIPVKHGQDMSESVV